MTDPPRRKRRRSEPAPGQHAFPRVAAMLRELRKQAGLSQEEVAARMNMSFSGFRPYERGDRDLSSEQIERFAEVFGVPISEVTKRLWPDDTQVVELAFSNDWDDLQRQTENLPPKLREMVLRAYRDSLAIASATSDLARRN